MFDNNIKNLININKKLSFIIFHNLIYFLLYFEKLLREDGNCYEQTKS